MGSLGLASDCSTGSTWCVITNSDADKDDRAKLKDGIDLVLGKVKETQSDLIFLGLQEYGRHVYPSEVFTKGVKKA